MTYIASVTRSMTLQVGPQITPEFPPVYTVPFLLG
jgi:hypothetical protein